MSSTEQVYALQHELNGLVIDIMLVSRDPQKARIAFDVYLNELESNWRAEDGGKVEPSNTFNRFSEPTGQYIFSANITRAEETHQIIVKTYDID